LPNGMLSGIWDVLAARSHLYATPGVASPATRLPPRGVGSLLASSSLSLSLLSLNGDPLDSIFAHYQCLPSSIFVCYVNYIKKCSTGEN